MPINQVSKRFKYFFQFLCFKLSVLLFQNRELFYEFLRVVLMLISFITLATKDISQWCEYIFHYGKTTFINGPTTNIKDFINHNCGHLFSKTNKKEIYQKFIEQIFNNYSERLCLFCLPKSFGPKVFTSSKSKWFISIFVITYFHIHAKTTNKIVLRSIS